jgi:choline dehydrogenase-like flavoprotein
VSGDRVVLAANGIESPRLCLLSDPGGPGLGNSSGLVGRCLMFHYQTIAVGLYPQSLHGERGRSVTTGIADFRGVPNDPNRPLGGIIEFGTNSEKITDALTYLLSLGQQGPSLKNFLRSSPFGSHNAVLIMQGEDAPQLTNRIDLDPDLKDINGRPIPRITYKPHAMELAARAFYGPKMIDIHGAAGAQFSFVSPPYDGGNAPTSRHVVGTLRMGTDPTQSVVDAVGKFHDLDNLWAMDGSVLTTGSGYNPTLTIQSVALRAAGAMVNPNSPGSVVENPV